MKNPDLDGCRTLIKSAVGQTKNMFTRLKKSDVGFWDVAFFVASASCWVVKASERDNVAGATAARSVTQFVRAILLLVVFWFTKDFGINRVALIRPFSCMQKRHFSAWVLVRHKLLGPCRSDSHS